MEEKVKDKYYDEHFKLVVVGDKNVGKTSIIKRFVDDDFSGHEKATIALDYRSKKIKVYNKIIKLTIWDTVGAERFHSLCQSYYKGVNGVLLVFDFTDAESFDHLN